MEAVIFCGIQASGKTSFFTERFVKTHIRISLDMLNTRNKEKIFLQTCLGLGQSFVIDNTNPTIKDRQRYIEEANKYRCKIKGYYFHTPPAEAISRNAHRTGKEHVPVAGIRGTYKKLQPLNYTEGFDELYWVVLANNSFVVQEGEYGLQPD